MYKLQISTGVNASDMLTWKTIAKYDYPVEITDRLARGAAKRVLDPDGNEIDFA